jgi:hypothetical protein
MFLYGCVLTPRAPYLRITMRQTPNGLLSHIVILWELSGER